MMRRSRSIAIITCLATLPLLFGCDDGAESAVSKSPDGEVPGAPPPSTGQDSPPAETEASAPAATEIDTSPSEQANDEEEAADSDAGPESKDNPQEPTEGSVDEQDSPPSMRRPFRRPPLPDETAPPRQPRVVRPSSTGSASSGGVAEITFDTIKFDIEPGDPFEPEMLTEDIEQLFGKKVRIRGYIYPPFQQTGIKQFVLVRDNMECCFGPGAALYDCVAVDMVDDKTIDYTVRPVAVEGTFRLNEVLGLGGEHLSVFHLDGVRVQ